MKKIGAELKRHALTAISYMLPLVVASGLLIAVGNLMGGENVTELSKMTVPNALTSLGVLGMGLLPSFIAGYISYSIADRPGIAPGLICGQLAVNVGAGFIGGIISGMLCGIFAQYLKRVPLPKSMQSLKSIMIVPIFTSLIVGAIMICVVGSPCAWLLKNLTEWLTSMSGASAVLVGAITGAMCGFDLGGPINKVAYSTGVAVVGTTVLAGQNCTFMAPIALGCNIPPIALGVETFLLKQKFTQEEKTQELARLQWESVELQKVLFPIQLHLRFYFQSM